MAVTIVSVPPIVFHGANLAGRLLPVLSDVKPRIFAATDMKVNICMSMKRASRLATFYLYKFHT
jgi:hypothetical protein